MRSRPLIHIATLALALVIGPQALAAGRSPYSMDVLVNGDVLDEIPSRGTTYVEARRGNEYSIRLRNDSGERIAVALSVDGLNSIDAKTTTPQNARKWILDPWQTITLDGWQTSDQTARRFVFTTEEDSYGRWLGKTKNLGIVSAAFFRERRPVAVMPYPRPEDDGPWWGGIWGDERRSAPAPEPSADSSTAQKAPSSPAREKAAPGSARDRSEGLAATGIGREVDHGVIQVSFDAEDHPACVLSIRYEYHDALVRLGVLPRYPPHDSLQRRERARGFEGGYAPDPYR